MNTIIEFILNVLGMPENSEVLLIYYILAGILLLIFIDGIIGFILSGINSITTRGK